MKIGALIGVVTALLFLGMGLMVSVSPVLEQLAQQTISGHQAGIYLATTGVITGLSCVVMGFILDRANSST